MEPLLRREIPETLLELFLVSNMYLINAGPLLVHTTRRKLLACHVFFLSPQHKTLVTDAPLACTLQLSPMLQHI